MTLHSVTAPCLCQTLKYIITVVSVTNCRLWQYYTLLFSKFVAVHYLKNVPISVFGVSLMSQGLIAIENILIYLSVIETCKKFYT